MSEPAIALREVVKRSGKRIVLDGVTATVATGRLVGLAGPCGAGKTMLLRLVAGLLRPDSGSIAVLGRDVVRDAAAVQAMIGYMPQRSGLNDHLTAVENLELHAALRNVTGLARRRRVDELLSLGGLTRAAGSRAGALPGGLRQKLSLACAVVGSPRLLLLDEPAAAVDPLVRRELFGFAEAVAQQGVTVLWSTASFDEAERCPTVLLLQDGRIIGQGPPADLAASLLGRAHAIPAIGPQRRQVAARLRAMPAVGDVQVQAAGVRFLTDEPAGGATLQGDAAAGEIVASRPRLEDCFITPGAGRSRPAAAPPSVPGSTVEVEGLGKRFGAVAAVDGLGFSAAPGEILGLIGPHGAGKTTILRLLGGLLSPTTGTARIDGIELRAAPAAARRRLGYMGQGFSLYGELSVAQNLRFCAAACGVERRRRSQRIDDVLAELGLASQATARAGDLPAGARQRLCLAATLVHEPGILLLDEPTADADPSTCRDLWRAIEAAAGGGATVILASPRMVEAESCDRVLLLDRGRTLAAGRPDELKAAFARGADSSIEEVFEALSAKRRLGNAA